MRLLWKSLGPGLITGAADDDPSGIATYSVAGAQLGIKLLWTALLTWPLMAAVQMMCARIGMVTGLGLAGNFKRRFPSWLLPIFIVALLAANTINIAADLAGMADAAEMLSGINSRWFVVGADWGRVARNTLVPSMPHSRDEWSMLVAILGTTISPYLFFWQASEEVEEEKVAGQSTLAKRRGATLKELELRNIDVGVGTFFSNMVMFFIILTTAITLNRHGITHIETTRQAAEALRPLAGKFAATLFTSGYCRRRFSCHPDVGGISGIRLRGNAGVAPRSGQEIKAGARVLHPHSPLNGSGCRTQLRRHQPREGALLDSCHQRIVSPLPSHRNPNRCFG
jgi:Mn2+/Fe2+ NRAMP family transporter